MIKWFRRYRELFRDIFFPSCITFHESVFEVTYVGLVHYIFVTLHIKYSQLIMKHIWYFISDPVDILIYFGIFLWGYLTVGILGNLVGGVVISILDNDKVGEDLWGNRLLSVFFLLSYIWQSMDYLFSSCTHIYILVVPVCNGLDVGCIIIADMWDMIPFTVGVWMAVTWTEIKSVSLPPTLLVSKFSSHQ